MCITGHIHWFKLASPPYILAMCVALGLLHGPLLKKYLWHDLFTMDIKGGIPIGHILQQISQVNTLARPYLFDVVKANF